ncbi:MAG: hypothetical protein QM802_09175 [Agriterribacter sp.]
MKLLAAAGEILPVLGTVGLLGLWLYQQKQLEKYTNELHKINSARNVFQTYQSNNALFNAIEAIGQKNKDATDKIRTFQIYNYELGLSDMEKLATEAEKKKLPIGNMGMPETNIETAMDNTQKRLGLLQVWLNEKETKIKSVLEKSETFYFWAYITFSIISISGAIFKITTK